MSTRYQKSEEMLVRARKTIPLGAQTFSKSITAFPHGVSPYFAVKAQGSHVWDVDGNEYVDYANALCAINLGYKDPDVDRAVSSMMESGTIFTLSHAIEHQVSELLVEMIPCAEMVRFGKNGSDATAGAIRTARAFTGRERVAVCGYHGWQDWYIGTTARNKGVPQAVRDLSHAFKYNDLNSLEALFKAHPSGFAAVIMEPMNSTAPAPGFLEGVRKLCTQHQTVLIFDETITGFRFANGGAQELFGVTPDLATFGKGIANGYPVSAVVGRADIMKEMEEIFFSFTFGGETLSLAAALATLQKLKSKPVTATLLKQGEKVVQGVRELISAHRLEDTLSISGHPSWSFLTFKDVAPYSQWQVRTLFLQEVFARGILTLGTHNMSFSHSDGDVVQLLKAYAEVFPKLRSAIDQKNLESLLNCKTLEPLFKVR